LSLAQDLFTRDTIVRRVMSGSNNSDSDVMGSSYSSTDDSSTSGDSAVTVDDEEHEKRCAAMNCALLRKPLSIQRSEVEARATAMKKPKEEVRSTLLGKALEMWQPPDDMPGHIGKMAKKALAKMTGAASSSQGPAAPPLKDTNSIMKTLANEFKANTIDETTLENKDAETPTTEDWKTKLPKRISKLVEECEYGIKHPEVLTAKHRLSQKMLENLTTEEAKEYAGIEGKGSQQKQSAFRLRIVKAKLKSVKDEWCHETKEGTIDIKKGTWLPFPMIVKKEGGYSDPENIVAALHYILKCLIMVGWCSVSSMTNRVQFFYVRQSKVEYFETSWTLRVKMLPKHNKDCVREFGKSSPTNTH
jgi:hypothetical protein